MFTLIVLIIVIFAADHFHHFMAIFGIIIFLLLSAIFSASEIAFISANKLAIEIQKKKGSRKSKLLTKLYDNHQSFLGTMLVGNNIALVVFTALMTKVLQPYIQPWISSEVLFLLVNTLIITVVVLLFGEFLPKTIARIYANQYINLMAYPLAFFKAILSIPTWFMTVTSSFVLKYILRAPVEQVDNPITRLDLENFIDSNVNSEDEEIETELFKNALNLKDIKVRECMIPRNEIQFVDIKTRIPELIEAFRKTGHSRLLVVKEDVENVVGYVHHLSLIDKPKNLRSIMREISYVPEAMNVQNLLTRFVSSNTNLACVVDEFGGTAGMITLEDILEEIFGEIEDEHDSEDYLEMVISETEFLLSGRLEIDHINNKYENIQLPEGEYHTLSGYIVMSAGNIPEEGEKIVIDHLEMIIEKVSDTKIDVIRVNVLEKNDSEDS